MRVPPRSPPISGATISNENWDGSPMTLAQSESAMMPQTPNGSMVLSWQNTAAQNNDGGLSLSASGPPQHLDAPPGVLAPTILVQNWRSNSLKLVNVSPNHATPIWIEAYGPGIPGRNPIMLNGNPVPVRMGDTLQGTANGYMQLNLQSSELGLFVVIWGLPDASGNNAYVFAVNFPSGVQTPSGYTATTTDNSYPYQFYWNGRIYVAYFGSGTVATLKSPLAVTPSATVTLTSLS